MEDMEMRNYDLTPFLRATVGFDRMFNMLDTATRLHESAPSYPPYNIEKTGEDSYRIVMAVAGFGEAAPECLRLQILGASRADAGRAEDRHGLWHPGEALEALDEFRHDSEDPPGVLRGEIRLGVWILQAALLQRVVDYARARHPNQTSPARSGSSDARQRAGP